MYYFLRNEHIVVCKGKKKIIKVLRNLYILLISI